MKNDLNKSINYCSVCGKALSKSNTIIHRSKSYCKSCFKSNFVRCDSCRDVIPLVGAMFNDNKTYCISCYYTNIYL